MPYQQNTSSKVKKRSESGLVSFFRIIHANALQTRRLGLPKEIIREFGNDLGDVALLKVSSCKLWSVELSRSDGGIYFCKGWHEFAEYYSIDVGHFLVFRYDGNSQFFVCIFDMSGCEIAYNLSSDESDASSDSVQVINPSFRITWTESYKTYLPIPCKFARRYLGKKADYFLTLACSDGRTWHVGYRGEPEVYFWRLGKGWPTFRDDMNLKEGNVLVFDFIFFFSRQNNKLIY